MPKPLNPGGLFSSELVQLFEDVERWILALRKGKQELGQSDGGTNPLIDAEDNQLPKLRDLLSRQYLRIGFLGGSQAGKSRTLNNFIGRKVVPVGALRSCTSTRIRLRNTQGPGQVVMRFMTNESFLQRRDDVGADLLKLYKREEAHAINNERVAKLLKEAIDNKRFNEDDRDVADFLDRILRSANRFPNVLAGKGREPYVEPIRETFENFEDLEAVLATIAKHPDDTDTRRESLLEEIDVCHREIPIPVRLELLDMPGLNTTQGQDEAYTLRAAAELDGALIAMNLGGNLKDPSTYKLTTLLAKRFPDLAERIWIVATKADTVPRDLLHAKAGENLIDSLGMELARHKIESDRVMLISNEYRDEIFSNVPKQQAIRTLKMEANPDGSPRLPDAINAHPNFRVAFESLAEDGGFGRLTRTVNTQVTDAVLTQVTSDVMRRIGSLIDSIEKLLREAEHFASLGKSGRTIARQWRKKFDQLLNQSYGSNESLKAVGRLLLTSLKKELHDSTKDFPAGADNERIVQLIRNLQEDLSECAETVFAATGPVQSFLKGVASEIADSTRDLPKPSFDPAQELSTRLEAIDAQWMNRLRTDVLSFRNPVLIGLDGKTSLARKDVLDLFEAKIQQVSRQTIYRIENMVRWHIYEVSKKLGRITTEDKDNPTSADDYKHFLTQLEEFKNRLKHLLNPSGALQTTVKPAASKEPTASSPKVETGVNASPKKVAEVTAQPAAPATPKPAPEATLPVTPEPVQPSPTPSPIKPASLTPKPPRSRRPTTNDSGNAGEY